MNAQALATILDGFPASPICIHVLAIDADTLTGSVSVYYLEACRLKFSHANLYQRQIC